MPARAAGSPFRPIMEPRGPTFTASNVIGEFLASMTYMRPERPFMPLLPQAYPFRPDSGSKLDQVKLPQMDWPATESNASPLPIPPSTSALRSGCPFRPTAVPHGPKKTTSDGIGNNNIEDIAISGSTVFLATCGGGLSYSSDGGTTWTTKTTTNGLANDSLYGVYATGSSIVTGGSGGVSISTDNGTTWTNQTGSDIYGAFTRPSFRDYHLCGDDRGTTRFR